MKKISLLIIIVFCFNCSSNEDNEPKIGLPTLKTNSITNILSTSAESGGNISDNGGTEIISKGICWNKNTNPTINDDINIYSGENEEYKMEIPNIESNTKYYVRAFATNSIGTSYGNELNFKTLKPITNEVILFKFTPDTGNNTSRLEYKIKFNNTNSINVNGFFKITLNIDGLINSHIANSNSQCYEIDADSSCILTFDEQSPLYLGKVNSIELVSVNYYLNN
ncbi:hypothetical protein [Tenacibaculum finnmarkense]|uniref:hypothetical protein n=1 Tax=Tenacibaculum finnmarkense TaxID=2781243 RepID=UPI000C5995E2|nr:hypothetical protein [Tenacibaculum finnmarkense]MCD8440913.1 hypothetical protein [Tenacibaculum finnmarkense genomovar ulcerans]MCG8721830.1 hypothetical protein [Tenacibaculum finnmarkense]SOS56319.1 hypothetical protein TFHFJT_760003 [Tenacibaculum finnmarkense]